MREMRRGHEGEHNAGAQGPTTVGEEKGEEKGKMKGHCTWEKQRHSAGTTTAIGHTREKGREGWVRETGRGAGRRTFDGEEVLRDPRVGCREPPTRPLACCSTLLGLGLVCSDVLCECSGVTVPQTALGALRSGTVVELRSLECRAVNAGWLRRRCRHGCRHGCRCRDEGCRGRHTHDRGHTHVLGGAKVVRKGEKRKQKHTRVSVGWKGWWEG